MKQSQPLLVAILLAAVVASTASAADQTSVKAMRLATLQWPPYNGLLLPQEGISSRIANVVAKAAGYRLLTAYFEWTVTMQKGEKDAGFDGYFPEYYSKEREQACHLSGPMGTSVLGIATLKKNPLYWKALPELGAHKLGVVEGYSNGEAFDQAIKDKRQPVEAAPSDAANVKKLLEGKIRGVVIDKKRADVHPVTHWRCRPSGVWQQTHCRTHPSCVFQTHARRRKNAR